MAEANVENAMDDLDSWLVSQFSENTERFGDMWKFSIPTEEVHIEVLLHFSGLSKKKISETIKKQFINCKVMKYRGRSHYFGLQRRAIIEQIIEPTGDAESRANSVSQESGPSNNFRKRPYELEHFDKATTSTQTQWNAVSRSIQTDLEVCDIPQEFIQHLPRQFFINSDLLDASKEVILGEGTFGVVKLMKFKGMEVAVKEFKEGSHYSLLSLRKRILNEATTLLNIPAHEGIPLFLGVSMAQKPYRLVTQLCCYHGKCITLLKLLQKNPSYFKGEDWIQIFQLLTSALHHVHSAGFLHNDIKSDNAVFMYSKAKRWILVLIDFSESGKTKTVSARTYRHQHDYLAPNILAGDAPSVESDVFSLCMLIKKVVQHTQIDGKIKTDLFEIAKQGTASTTRPNSKQLFEMILKLK
eukprot:gene13480-14876_t